MPADRARRYRDQGWWTDETLGEMVAAGLPRNGDQAFRVRSAVRPWQGTFAEVDRSARALAGALRDEGVGPGDVVLFQLPNWVEAGITFWAAAYLGAVVVPVVHFYGPKEVDYILGTASPAVVVTADRFGHNDYLETYRGLLSGRPGTRWLVVGDAPAGGLPAPAVPFDSYLDADPVDGPLPVDPGAPAIIGFTSGTTRDPKGVIHSHRTIGCETRQLDYMFPRGGPPRSPGRRSATSSGCSTPSWCRCSGTAR